MAQVNLSIEQKETHRHGEQTCGCQGGSESVMDWEFVASRCKLKMDKQWGPAAQHISVYLHIHMNESLCYIV